MAEQSARIEDGGGNIIVQAVDSTVSIGVPATLKLIPWHRRPRAAKSDVGLLDPFTNSIPFVGRAAELARHLDWLRGPAPISARCLTGRAGAGKTRLAIALCNRAETLADRGWDAGFLSHAELQRFFDKENMSTWGWRRPTLIVLDYAAGIGRSLKPWLEELSRNPGQPGRPLRLLLLERFADDGTGWWAELMRTGWSDADVPWLFDPPAPEPLDPIAPGDRGALRAAMRQAVEAGPNSPTSAPSLPGLSRQSMNPRDEPGGDVSNRSDVAMRRVHAGPEAVDAPEALDLLMAELTAAKGIAPAGGTRPEMARALAQHERRRLDGIARDRGLDADPFAHVAAVLTLQGGAEVEAALEMVAAEADALRSRADPHTLCAALRDAYAPPDGERLPPIQPDLIGEAFVIEAFRPLPAKQQEDAIGHARARAEAATIATVIRTAQDFATDMQHPALRWLDTLVSGCADLQAGMRLADAFPEQTVVLRERATAVTSILVAHLRAARTYSDDPSIGRELARRLNHYSLRLFLLGRRKEALSTIEEAVLISRALASARPDELLALTLSTLSACLSALDRREEALSTIKEAVSIFRDLATDRPDAIRPGLASALNDLSLRLIHLGCREEALSAGEEAVCVYRDLAASRPSAFLRDLAVSLNNLSSHLCDLGRSEAALRVIKEAVAIRRPLAAARPDAFSSDLASSLSNLSDRLSDLGMREAALSASEEAVAICRALATRHPAAFGPDLALVLNNLSVRLLALQRKEEALSTINEALSIFRHLAVGLPGLFIPRVAGSLNNLSVILGNLGRPEEALTAIDEAVVMYRDLAAVRPDVFRPDLARSLNALSSCLKELGYRERALSVIEEAVTIRRGLAAVRPEAFRPDLAKSLASEANCLNEMGNLDAALRRDCESIGLLTPQFVLVPPAFAELMQAICRDYLRRCEAAGVEPDAALLAPVIEVLQRMQGEKGDDTATEEE